MAAAAPQQVHPMMQRALRLARRGQGNVEPNPMVGCVLYRDQKVLGEGYHRRFGAAHAEVEAIRHCRERGFEPEGCEVFVTLEPCAHHGKTPPCADALIAERVARVHIAMPDPDPRVSGRGIEKLRSAGIGVRVGEAQGRAERLNRAYIKRTAAGLPWIIAKWAQTVDGAIATRHRDSRWISCERSRRVVHRLRGRVDAVVVGIGTVIADNPQLTARDVRIQRVARRVVVDPNLRLSASAKLIESADPAHPVTIAVSKEVLEKQPEKRQNLASSGVEFFGLPGTGDRSQQSLRGLFEHLARTHSATNVLVEGGGRLVFSLFRQSLVDQALVFVAPKLLGDTEALHPVHCAAPAALENAERLVLDAVKRIDDDVLLDYRVMRA